ncbi:MAG: TIGR01777 family oxidoreductase [Kiritimatiellia bacterium]
MVTQTNSPILLTGASGLLARHITALLDQRQLPWKAIHHGDPGWKPNQGICDPALLEGCAAVIHLAGEPIAARRWNEEQKQRIRLSRTEGTRAVAEAMAACDSMPRTLICASAVGYYGDRGEETLTEISGKGTGFLPEVVAEWEAAAAPAREAGIRVLHLRLGVVLSTEGGALAKMLPVFKLGLGGRLGNGRMWMSWIHVEDAARAFVFGLEHSELKGVFNLTAPHPVRNAEFTRTLGQILHRPALLPAPAFAIKLLLGEMGESLLLSSTRALPSALEKHKFQFNFSALEPCLRELLGKSDSTS